ncbi:peptidyl-prolyl cis-trans isomerase [Myxococcus sp. CA051A]|uniref:Foldase n=1 Tax=Myxococcus llanfairpwllgwyngyllgogerychwyrndrobwllllantysiliogogogochensis TaxID=2590453 RepID=A0A540WM85_9BACT|nr:MULTISPECIES: peptidyl-prolyl cis-trans isomerase [Myxococcus]NTX05358.1 peptidyl-prolyl cis-trans isomerase [Myxococcus sp. CA040A]NTX40061.1 peptidyl-prolyl cis-trans isomerase [Myxococcus sp. CA033]NTX57294.1 peptidyl-prolyl cis-trans isomerase [Myxococcus sp. CA039A]NTX64447.1 peptidyl-prolyl cis-trans isomerase [Myxococcus sp. CA051A]TQF09957.1 foldase [Myxococcus llanfairpwllgwyngyllgogerychwyrndrobwllllantysiliogogogochensis]
MRLSPTRAPLLSLVLALALSQGCNTPVKLTPDDTVVATVNGEVLSRVDFEQELGRELASTEASQRTPEEIEPFKRTLLDTYIHRMLLLQAARKNNVTVTPEEVDRGVLRLSGDYPAGNFNEVLAQGQLSMSELRAREASRLTIEKLFASHVYARVGVTEEELRAYYAAHEAELNESEQVHAAQIVVKGLDEARRLQTQLKSGKKFSDLARRYSLSADAKVGGDLGFFPRGQMPPAFDEVVFKLGVGQVSDVVSTEYGYHLFKVLERKPARKRDFAEARQWVEAKLMEQKRTEAQDAFEKELRDKAQVQVNETTLQAIRGQPAALPQAAK